MSNKGVKNLKPIYSGQLSQEELKKRQSNGGKKSAEVRRKKKLLKDELLTLLEAKDNSGATMRERICFSLMLQAKEGNVKAFEVIRNTIGEAIPEKIETINSNIDITDKAIIDEVYRKIKEL